MCSFRCVVCFFPPERMFQMLGEKFGRWDMDWCCFLLRRVGHRPEIESQQLVSLGETCEPVCRCSFGPGLQPREGRKEKT